MNLYRYRIGMYVLMDVAVGIGGILLATRSGSGQPVPGLQGLELKTTTAAIQGGCAMAGGDGTVIGALLAVEVIRGPKKTE